MALSRAEWLANLVRDCGLARGAEIGVQAGQTMGHLLRACPWLHMIGVDLWAPQPGRPEELSRHLAYRHADNEAKARALAAEFSARCEVMKGHGADVAARVADGALDFVFIDADHAEDAVAADIEAWRPKLRAGGFLTGHDRSLPGVGAALERLVPGVMPGPDDCWWVTV